MRTLIIALGMLSALPAAADSPGDPLQAPTTQHYSHEQKTRLGFCLGLADNNYAIARHKLAGDSKASVMTFYAGNRHAMVFNLMSEMVDRVYSEKFDNAWTNTTEFFGECGAQMAGIATGPGQPANFCMRQAIVAGNTGLLKSQGRSADAIKQEYAFVGEAWLSPVIDAAYGFKDVGGAESSRWESCMAPLSDD